MTAEIQDTQEHRVGENLGIKIRLAAPTTGPDTYKLAGERVAAQNSDRCPCVWVWTYAHDMDLLGPAVCVSYVGADSPEPVTEFVDPRATVAYYMSNPKHLAASLGAEVPEGRGD